MQRRDLCPVRWKESTLFSGKMFFILNFIIISLNTKQKSVEMLPSGHILEAPHPCSEAESVAAC